MTDLVYVAISFGFVFFVIMVSTVLQNRKILDDEGARKFVHIGVSHWWFFVFLFENIGFAIIAPIAFILLNYLSYRQNIFKAIERSGKGNLGTVYFPISLLLLVIFTFLVGEAKTYQYLGALAMLILGYGDGLAAVIGKKFGKTILIKGKSVEGSLVMFLASAFVTAFVLIIYTPSIALPGLFLALIPFIATVIEMFTPKGFDNLTVPLGVLAFSYLYVILLPLVA